jgi:hypothetical protein
MDRHGRPLKKRWSTQHDREKHPAARPSFASQCSGAHHARDSANRNDGLLSVLDGKVLLKKNLGDQIGGGIVPYEIGGVAYVAIACGMKNTVTQQTDSGPAWVAILALPK